MKGRIPRAAECVVFRMYPGGDVIALFPNLPADIDGKYCTSYEHIGQHGAADYALVISKTRPAQYGDYKALALELQRAGYILSIRERRTARAI